jgi:LmbE family N-acetylglucosaminyl deacetylase
MKKILIFSPHPDDETLGAGGAIAKHAKNGDSLYWCIVTEGYTPEWSEQFLAKRKKEVAEVEKIYGFKKTFSLGFPSVKLDLQGSKKINDAIAKVISEVKPDVIYAPYPGDLNIDHGIVFHSIMVASRPKDGMHIEKILCYETLSETEWGAHSKERAFVPNAYVDIQETFEIKMKAMHVYSSELKSPPHPRSAEVLKALAVKRGSECGLMMAEAFQLVRLIE